MSIASRPVFSGLPRTALVSAGAATIAAAVGPSVVVIGHRGGGGAGVIWQADGLIVTNRHVARGDQLPVRLVDGRELTAEVIARHPNRDLALLRIDAPGLAPARVGDSAEVRPGQIVLAFGHPVGYRNAVTLGIIVGAGPAIPPDRSRPGDWLQTDVTLLPGNSGGPLVNAAGEVIGISTMIAGRLSLGVPSNTVTAFVEDVLRPHPPAYLGIAGLVVDLPRATPGVGFMVTDVTPGSPAAISGLLQGDILTQVGSTDVVDQESVPAAILRLRLGEPVSIAFVRAGVATSGTLVPAPRPA